MISAFFAKFDFCNVFLIKTIAYAVFATCKDDSPAFSTFYISAFYHHFLFKN